MSTERIEGRAGGFAAERFAARRRWWAFVFVAVLPVAVEVAIALLLHQRQTGFLVGLAIGAGLGGAIVLFDSPPTHIENWRTGSQGEKATARQLRPLVRRGWTLYNDIDAGHGNIDHVLVGPAGVFMLESKRLSGQVAVREDTLFVRWHEDPTDGYQNDSIANRARGSAHAFHLALASAGVPTWVQGVVVLWGDFEQRSIKNDHLAWVRGDVLAAVLAARPVRYSGVELVNLTAATRSAVSALRGSGPPSAGASAPSTSRLAVPSEHTQAITTDP